jgi:hypothetical protein
VDIALYWTKLSNKKKTLLLSILTFLIVFCILGLPYTKIGFSPTDDYGMFWNTKINSIADIKYFFDGSKLLDTAYVKPSHYAGNCKTFFSVFYRPVGCTIFALYNYLFNFASYKYLLAMIFFHALNSVLIFFIFLNFFEHFTAFFAALFFAFHLSQINWINWLSAQIATINLTFILLSFLCFKKSLDKHNYIWISLASMFYGLSIFLRENSILFPFWVFIGLMLHSKYITTPKISLTHNFINAIKATLPLFFVTISYLLIRINLFPFLGEGTELHSKIIFNPTILIKTLGSRFYELINFSLDITNLSFLQEGQTILKLILIPLVSGLLVYLFLKSNKKTLIILCILSIFFFSWSIILRCYYPHYMYKSLPFICIIIIFLLSGNSPISWPLSLPPKKIAILASFVVINAFIVSIFMQKHEKFSHHIHTAFKDLTQNPLLANKPICLVCLPSTIFFSGMAQAIWMQGFPINIPIYYDQATWTRNKDPYSKNHLVINPVKNGLQLKSDSPNNFWFSGGTFLPMGKIQYTKTNTNGNVCEMIYIFDQKYLDQDMTFVTWDYEKQRFMILDKSIKPIRD